MRLFFSLTLLLRSLAAFAQDPSKSELAPCGAPPGISSWLRAYSARPQDWVTDRSNDTLYVGLQIHLVAKDNGTGRFAPERLLDAFCRLNADFAAARVRFYFKNEWHRIDSTGWWQHETVPQGIDMMLANDVPDAQNTYFVSDPAGNCGYNLPYASVAVSHSCAAANDHTWAHEVGHALSLPHPFIGWEGKVYSPLNPTPDTVTYNYTYFHDTIDTQIPAPLDTALVEYVDGSNCAIAADLICDTKPDYLSYRWDCDGQNNSFVQQKDPSGATFYSDGTLFMSYSYDECQNRFSDGQIATLRANLLSEKINWLTDGPSLGDITASPELISPVGGQLSPVTGTVLHWSAAPNATRYVVQVSRFTSFISKELDIVTSDTTYTLGTLDAVNQIHYWRVRPFNEWFGCTQMTPSATFKTTSVSQTTEPDADGWRCYPSLLAPGQYLTLEMPETWLNRPALCAVYDASGRSVWNVELLPTGGKTLLQLPSSGWSAGVYRLVFANEKGVKSQSVLLVK